MRGLHLLAVLAVSGCCIGPGYKASRVQESLQGFTADLTLAGSPCNVYGTDVRDLFLQVSYQASERLNVRILPKYIAPYNSSWFILPTDFVDQPQWDGKTTTESSDLQLQWENDPMFQFSVTRKSNREEIFSTFGHVIVFEDQFLELVTNMVDDYNVYGLAENIHNFRLGTNSTQTLFNADTADALDGNAYGTHPFYQETRYYNDRPSTAHGVYARNAHAQEWLLREKQLTYRTIGGSFDLYFLSGETRSAKQSNVNETRADRSSSRTLRSNSGSVSSAVEVYRQYQAGCVGLPALQMYWTFGFHQCHWGWNSLQEVEAVVESYYNARIPLEAVWTDIDVYDRSRVFTLDEDRFPSAGMKSFVERLHARDQHYVSIIDSNVYFPDPTNSSDSYPPFDRGSGLSAFVRDSGTGYFYIGSGWPGLNVWTDWLASASEKWFATEMELFHQSLPYDGIWIDLNEVQSFCNYSCGNAKLPYNLRDLAHDSVLSQDPRNLNDPPYKINSVKSSKQIVQETMALNATHNDQYNTTEYDQHSLWGIGISRAAYGALSQNVYPGKRPFIITRSTFAGSGRYVGHWGGDNDSRWGALFLSISQAFIFQMSGIPMFGTDTCGYGTAANATEELCARWMELNAFFPFYRNHYAIGKSPQEAYVWESVAEASRRVIAIRYSLLTYIYTLFFNAHTHGDTVVRAMAWEFPNDETLRAADAQFLLGPALLVSPVLTQGDTSVNAVFPGIGEGERWYDWYTLAEVTGVRPQQNVTLSAPLEHINLHIRGGSILPLQKPANTTKLTKDSSYSLLIALDQNASARGSLYLDDGESIQPKSTKTVEFRYSRDCLVTKLNGSYNTTPPLANVTITGIQAPPHKVMFEVAGYPLKEVDFKFVANTLYVTDLEQWTKRGAWGKEFNLYLGRD